MTKYFLLQVVCSVREAEVPWDRPVQGSELHQPEPHQVQAHLQDQVHHQGQVQGGLVGEGENKLNKLFKTIDLFIYFTIH